MYLKSYLRHLAFTFFCVALVLATARVYATIDSTLQMQLGNPSGATTDPNNHDHYLILHTVEAIDYSDNLREPNWASWDLTASDVGSSGRSDAFAADTNLPPGFYEVQATNYSGSGYDRGHMCPSADRTDNLPDNVLVFLMDNMIPQASDNNSVIWANFESYCRALAATNEILIICGPGGFTGARTTSSGSIAIPSFTWKVAVSVPPGSGTATNRITTATRVIAIEVPNTNGVSSVWQNFITSAGRIERDTGLTFFTALPATVASALRSKVDGSSFPAPQITSFTPSNGETDTNVVIAGSNFTSASVVSFNGTPSVFSVDSNTQITAIVPATATSGLISVTTPSGTANSPSIFAIATTSATDLAVTSSHAGSFTQGDTGDTYTLIVTNVGSAASSGLVTVSNSLPDGLTATALSGTGWTINFADLTATRSDSLPAGVAYPALTVSVSVAPTAASSLTNMVVVSGGGETNTSNDAAIDPTVVAAAAAAVAVTGSVTGVNSTSVTLSGTVNAENQPASARFEYGLTTSYGSTVAISSNIVGNTAQNVTTSISSLSSSTTYHYRLDATNILGGSSGSDQMFTTAAAGTPDLALTLSHTGNFTQGDSADVYTITITNVGSAASSGTVTVADTLPTGMTVIAMSGTGWVTNLSTISATRSDSLASQTAYSPLTITVAIASNASSPLTNTATVSGGSDGNSGNNSAQDNTVINLAAPVTVTLVGWDTGSLTNYGPSPFPATTNAAHVTPVSFARGLGVATNTSGASNAFGGLGWTNATAANAVASNQFLTCGVAATSGYKMSISSISRFDYRRSGTGPATGVLQFQVGSGSFTDITTLAYTNSNSGGSSIGAIDLSSIPALQNVGGGTNVTFRIVNYGGGPGGTWYVFDVAKTNNADFGIDGTITPVVTAVPDLLVTLSHSGSYTQADHGDICSIVVSNTGAAASFGTVSVTNLLPIGLIATAISGTGWTPNLATLSCTRNDNLAAGTAFPPIQVTVTVTTNAPASLTNQVLVAGGGETNLANDSANDVIAVTPLSPSELWRLTYFGNKANMGSGSDGAIATSDGLPNLYKYALGLNPLVATNDPVTVDIATSYLRLTAPKNPDATDVSLHGVISSALTGLWSTNNTTITENSSTLFQVQDTSPVGSNPQRFMRLQVTRP
jgi:uncharacterized repeat protein (TIGR01451 family)